MYIRKTKRQYKAQTYTNYVLVESVRTGVGPRQKTVCSLGNLEPRSAAEWLQLAHRIEDALVGQGWLPGAGSTEAERLVRRAEAAWRGREQASAASGAGPDTGTAVGSGPQPDTGAGGSGTAGDPRSDAGVVGVSIEGVSTECYREAGPVHVGCQFWSRLGLAAILADAGLSERARLLTCAMVMNRLIAPRSEHAMPAWIEQSALGDILGHDVWSVSDDALYRNLDVLYPQREQIESALAERERTLFNLESCVLFYDLTSSYFEGAAELNEKARRGYSRDKRSDCKQVVVGLVIGKEGFPTAHEVFAGNTQDRQSLGPMLEVLARRKGIKPGQTVVVDRGMAFEENLADIRSRHLHYVVASRQTERHEWLAEFEDLNGFGDVLREPSPLNPCQQKGRVRVKRCPEGTGMVVLCISEGRQGKDRAIREKQEQRLLLDLGKLQQRIANGKLTDPLKIGEAIGRLRERYPRVARYYRLQYDAKQGMLTSERDQARYALARELDGAYMLKTDRDDLGAEEAWRLYATLTRAESAFRAMKSPLAERPIFHQLTHRVETHIFLCVLAYHLLVAIENTLLARGEHTSWGTVRDALRSHQICTVVMPADNGDILKIRRAGTPEPQHRRLYRLLDIPPGVVPQQRTWVRRTAQSSDGKQAP